jgi:hypothetical protein
VTARLIGIGIGLLAASIVAGYRIRRARALRDLEEEIPAWVNEANQAVRDDIYEQVKTAVHFELWEDEFERRTRHGRR